MSLCLKSATGGKMLQMSAESSEMYCNTGTGEDRNKLKVSERECVRDVVKREW